MFSGPHLYETIVYRPSVQYESQNQLKKTSFTGEYELF